MDRKQDRKEILLAIASYYRSSKAFHEKYRIDVIPGGVYPSIGVTNKDTMVIELIYHTREMSVNDIKKALARKYGHLVTAEELPPKEKKVYTLIKSFYDRYGKPPTKDYLSEILGYKSKHTITENIKILHSKNYLEKRNGRYYPIV